jgi:hypothetical protein
MNFKPNPEEYAVYYGKYIDLVENKNIVHILEDQIDELKEFLNPIDEEKSKYRYAEGKWSIREVIGHIIDTERIFAYRALCIARADKNALPGFDQDYYVVNSNHHDIKIERLEEEFFAVRLSNILLFETFSEEMLSRTGIANNNKLSVKAASFIIAGHFKHHLNVLKEKYLA